MNLFPTWLIWWLLLWVNSICTAASGNEYAIISMVYLFTFYFPARRGVFTDRCVEDQTANRPMSRIMSAEVDLSPPEVPEPTFLENLLRYGLFLGAIFQLICILAVIFPTSKSHEQVSVPGKERSKSAFLSLETVFPGLLWPLTRCVGHILIE